MQDNSCKTMANDNRKGGGSGKESPTPYIQVKIDKELNEVLEKAKKVPQGEPVPSKRKLIPIYAKLGVKLIAIREQLNADTKLDKEQLIALIMA